MLSRNLVQARLLMKLVRVIIRMFLAIGLRYCSMYHVQNLRLVKIIPKNYPSLLIVVLHIWYFKNFVLRLYLDSVFFLFYHILFCANFPRIL